MNSFLQNTTVHITVNNNQTSINAAEKSYDIPVPAVIPTNMIVAVRPSANSTDQFWLAQVTGLRTEQPLVYNLRYFQYNKSKKGWFIMKGSGAYGWVPHTAIMAAGIEFNNDHSLKVSSVRMLTKKLQQK